MFHNRYFLKNHKVARSARSCATARRLAPFAFASGRALLALWCVHFPSGRKKHLLLNASISQKRLCCEMPAQFVPHLNARLPWLPRLPTQRVTGSTLPCSQCCSLRMQLYIAFAKSKTFR